MSDTIEWRDVADFEGYYQVSSAGQVRSVDRTIQRSTGALVRLQGKPIVPAPDRTNGGHLKVGLSKDNRHRTHAVHRLVARAFIGTPGDGQEVCHADGDVTNNSVDNLRFDTHAGNMEDMRAHGTNYWRERPACQKGHLYTEANTGRNPRGARVCLTCKRDGMIRRKKKNLSI